MPAAKMIADKIDFENIEAIALSCEEAGFSANDIDQITAIYCHEISWALDQYVSEAIWRIGLPTDESDDRKVQPVFKSSFHPDQIFFNFKEV
jgi:hypothetical protein